MQPLSTPEHQKNNREKQLEELRVKIDAGLSSLAREESVDVETVRQRLFRKSQARRKPA